MTYRVRIANKDAEFEAEPDEYLLDSAIIGGAPIAFVCRGGTCRTCLVRVVEGTLEQDLSFEPAIQPSELGAGWRLACCAYVRSDLVVETKR
ncbi:2Fe-2S iron-sulfur cluster-binding protein [Cohnella silvisoli]|uniref:2Fe-2S iron-sulfur cluster binding domain-containing protein n=1 Tax=Cohnella silvisoli TaxID=2873699 RepID=A0ABV1KUG8_9BACL|nr:2Fe-2S iron-sulfur cluster binding domain-containing protein [Cohnella silvisoli]MCD9021360.1 2Fe-2S iron-sulfur cluster binding domain-containing protein [Cohnella silvisoli]